MMESHPDNSVMIQNLYQQPAGGSNSIKMLQGSASIKGNGGIEARYNSALNILPVIGSEVNLDTAKSRDLNRINSKVELTRKDVQNFLVNGSVSKEFIH